MAGGVWGWKNRPAEDGEGESGWVKPTAGDLCSVPLEEKQLLSASGPMVPLEEQAGSAPASAEPSCGRLCQCVLSCDRSAFKAFPFTLSASNSCAGAHPWNELTQLVAVSFALRESGGKKKPQDFIYF